MTSVTELGEDGGRWLVADVTDVNAARVFVLRLLREQLLPGDPECFAGEVDALLDAEVHVYHYPICVHPETERLYYQSPVGHGAPLSEWIASSGVTFGVDRLTALTSPRKVEAMASLVKASTRLVQIERDDARARAEAAEQANQRVRAIHYAADNDLVRTPVCSNCEGKAGVHDCGCWADEDRQPVCGHCNEGWKGASVPWPCATVRALDGGEQHG